MIAAAARPRTNVSHATRCSVARPRNASTALGAIFAPGNRRKMSRIPAKNPTAPNKRVNIILVCSQRSRKYPISPPTMTAATRTKGSSMASANWLEKFFTFPCAGSRGLVLSGLESEGIVREPREGFRIQPGGERDKHRYAERYGLRVGHQRPRRFTGLLKPGMHDDAEVVVQRGNDVQHREDREHGMLRFNEREEDEILAHEARGRRDSRKRKHED